MRSIRTKLTLITLIAILVSVVAVGGVSIFSIRNEGERSSYKEMTLICENLEKSVEEYLRSVGQSVDMISLYAGEDLAGVDLMETGLYNAIRETQVDHTLLKEEEQERLGKVLAEHTEKIETLFHSVANHTNGVVAYYYRFNPELSQNVKGFFYTKVANAAFVSHELTDLSLYDPDDVEHVGWFYIPQERGKASWLAPYYNDNIDVSMVSYIVPIYKAGVFIGVIGMDIGMDTLVRQVKDEVIYQSGYACLLQADGTIVYHPTLPAGENVTQLFSQEGEPLDLHATHSKQLIPLNAGGVEKRMAFSTLSNDMKLMVTAPLSEINANWYQLINVIIIASLLIIFVFITLMAVTLGHITEPLRRLTDASKRISDGDYDVVLDYDGNDELGILTRSFQQLVDHLKIYIKDLNSKAYRDALTGVKNKGAFDISSHKLNDVILLSEPGNPAEFAIVMMDCNDLKRINDQLGHDKGDIYLRTACMFICKIFAHSPVFRLGGDEFAAILQKDDFFRREELLEHFHSRAAEVNATAEHQWERISIAIGMAVYDQNLDPDVENVLRRADEIMYEDKRRTKAAAKKKN